jgi:hypothetical protein
MPDHNYQILLPSGFDPQHTEPDLGVVASDAFNQPR